MRRFLFSLILTLVPATLFAQGRILPRPCIRPCAVTLIQRVSSVVRVELENGVLQYEITESFKNSGTRVAEAEYLFPLPTDAAFQDLKLSINGEMIAGEMMDAAKARAVYERIVREQRDPALVEWMGQGLLRARIFPVNAGETRTIVVRYHTVAKREGNALRVDYTRANRPSSIAREDGFTLIYPTSDAYGTAYSPTHRVSAAARDKKRVVEVQGEGRDITVLIPLSRGSGTVVTTLTHAANKDEQSAMVTISPPEKPTHVTPRDVTVVLDVSGSMSGAKIKQAQAAVRQVLSGLRSEDRFRLIDFASMVRMFRDNFVPATSSNIQAAHEYVDALDANGGTNIEDALRVALKTQSPSNRLPLVLFVTDGEPTVGERRASVLTDSAAHWRGRMRLFTFGLGADVNVTLLEQLAIGGRGTAQFVRPSESVEHAVSVTATRLATPVLTNVRVRIAGGSSVRLEQMVPQQPLDLFAGQDLVILAKYTGSGRTQVVVDGTSPTGPTHLTSTIDFPSQRRENGFIPKLWAAQRIGYLVAEWRKSNNAELKEEIKSLGERYGIPTPLTAYLVQEPDRSMRVTTSYRRAIGGVVSGAASGTVAAAPRAQAFESARTASGQRAAKTLQDVVVAGPSARAGSPSRLTRHVGSRVFVLQDSIWTDTREHSKLSRMRIAPFSDAYFAVLAAIPELRDIFALGSRVRAAGRLVVIELDPDGTRTLNRVQVAALRSRW